MSVQYKSSDGWKNISSSSNNAVDTVAEDNMGAVTSNAVWEWSRYENAVRLNFNTTANEGVQIDTTIYDTADKQMEYMLNYVRDISIAKDKSLTYIGLTNLTNATNTTSVAQPIVYSYIISTNKGASNYWTRGRFFVDGTNAYINNAVAGLSQAGVFWVYRQCERSQNFTLVANNLSITAAAPTSTYTADRDGEVIVHITNQTGGYTPTLVVNSAAVDSCPFHRPGACTLRARVSKGDTYYVSTDTPAGDSRMFINAMGIQGISHWTNRAASW